MCGRADLSKATCINPWLAIAIKSDSTQVRCRDKDLASEEL
jgi:hypothetical protein